MLLFLRRAPARLQGVKSTLPEHCGSVSDVELEVPAGARSGELEQAANTIMAVASDASAKVIRIRRRLPSRFTASSLSFGGDPMTRSILMGAVPTSRSRLS